MQGTVLKKAFVLEPRLLPLHVLLVLCLRWLLSVCFLGQRLTSIIRLRHSSFLRHPLLHTLLQLIKLSWNVQGGMRSMINRLKARYLMQHCDSCLVPFVCTFVFATSAGTFLARGMCSRLEGPILAQLNVRICI